MAENRRIRCRTLDGRPLSDEDAKKIIDAVRLSDMRSKSKASPKICIVVRKDGAAQDAPFRPSDERGDPE